MGKARGRGKREMSKRWMEEGHTQPWSGSSERTEVSARMEQQREGKRREGKK